MGIDRPIDITPEQRKTILALLERHLPNTTAWIYGSRANWSAHPRSDLDMVVFAKLKQSGRVSELREAFEESDLPFRVDLFAWNLVPENFRKQIMSDYVVLVEKKRREVRNHWKKVTLGDHIEINDATYSRKEAWKQITYLDTGSVSENRISGMQKLVVGRDTIPSRARRKIQTGDIVYSTVRPNQRHYGLLKEPPENILVSTGFAVIRGKKELACTDFIYWFLAQDHIVEQLHTIAEHSTSAYPSIRPKDIETLQLHLPPLPEQRAIAHVLGTLDDKIELNRRMNETLEAMAQAIFKDWFVDFGPTRAKMQGRAPYLAPELWALFPDALGDDGKPIGWYQSKLGDHISVLETGKRPRGGVAGITEGIPSVGAESIVGVGEFDFSKTKYVPSEFFSNMGKGHASDGDVLIYKDGGKPGELRPAVTYVSKQFPFTRFCINEHVFRVRTESLSQPLLYCLLSTDDVFWQMRERATGVAQPGLNRDAVNSIDFTMPDDKRLLSAAASSITPILDGCNYNSLQSRTLAKTRDLLLPKLISGEIRLRNAEKALERTL